MTPMMENEVLFYHKNVLLFIIILPEKKPDDVNCRYPEVVYTTAHCDVHTRSKKCLEGRRDFWGHGVLA